MVEIGWEMQGPGFHDSCYSRSLALGKLDLNKTIKTRGLAQCQ